MPSPNALLSLSDQILVGQSFVPWKLESSFHEGNQDTIYVYIYICVHKYIYYIYSIYYKFEPMKAICTVFKQSGFRGRSRERCKGVATLPKFMF